MCKILVGDIRERAVETIIIYILLLPKDEGRALPGALINTTTMAIKPIINPLPKRKINSPQKMKNQFQPHHDKNKNKPSYVYL